MLPWSEKVESFELDPDLPLQASLNSFKRHAHSSTFNYKYPTSHSRTVMNEFSKYIFNEMGLHVNSNLLLLTFHKLMTCIGSVQIICFKPLISLKSHKLLHWIA